MMSQHSSGLDGIVCGQGYIDIHIVSLSLYAVLNKRRDTMNANLDLIRYCKEYTCLFDLFPNLNDQFLLT